jgi:hypothetical protein
MYVKAPATIDMCQRSLNHREWYIEGVQLPHESTVLEIDVDAVDHVYRSSELGVGDSTGYINLSIEQSR